MNTKIFLLAAALSAALLAAACSTDSSNSSSSETTVATTEAGAAAATVTQPETAATVTEAAEAAAEAQGLPPAPGSAGEASEPAPTAAPTSTSASTTTTTTNATSTSTSTSTTTSTTSAAPVVETETSELPSTTTTTTTSTSAAPVTTTTTTTTTPSPVTLQVQVLNGSGVAGAAGRLTSKLAEAGYVVLPAGNAPQRYATSAVYFQDGWQDRAEEILQIVELDEIEQVSAMPQQFISPDASVVVLIGRDTAPAAVRSSGPAPITRYRLGPEDVPINVPKDRFDARAFGASLPVNVRDRPEDVARSSSLLKRAAYCFEDEIAYFEDNCLENDLPAIWAELEQIFDRLGFTSKNVCGSVATGSFTDGIVHTAEWNPATKNYSGRGFLTTDRLIEVNRQAGIDVQRINPEANLDFYLRKAAQSAYDRLRFEEIMKETSASHLILCAPWVAGSLSMPWAAYSVANTFAVPVKDFWSQSTYHIKEISRNGNLAYIVVCHPTLGQRHVLQHWSASGYRSTTVGPIEFVGCQQSYESEESNDAEDTFIFTFGERVFTASELLDFPRATG